MDVSDARRAAAARGIAEVVIRQAMREHYESDLGQADLVLSRKIAESLCTAGLLRYGLQEGH